MDNHTYRLDVKTVTEGGIEKNGANYVRFVRGSKLGEGIERQDGFFTEQLLDVCREYLESVNVGNLKNPHTSAAVVCIEAALRLLKERQEDRVNRGVAQTYKK